MAKPAVKDPTRTYLDYRAIEQRGVTKSRQGLDKLIANHGFPVGIIMGGRARRWNEAEVDAWVNARQQATPPPSKPKSKRTAK